MKIKKEIAVQHRSNAEKRRDKKKGKKRNCCSVQG
jgi:hypothetical protein